MAYTKTILCLAASRKHGGYCFAGKDLETDQWIRPVSNRPDEEISDGECTGPNGTQAKLLDILEIPLLRPTPHGYQTENHLIDPSRKWKKTGEATWQDVERALDDHDGPLWLNRDSSWGFSNNRVKEPALDGLDNSLVLIRPKVLRIGIGQKGGLYADAMKRLVKAYFSHVGVDYTLAVTDPIIEDRFRAGLDRTEDMTGAVACVSLGEIYRGHAYKLVAAIMAPRREV
ncbi:MAG: dual OB domain-containing protein [Gammaproteobacteria bacterium]